MLKSCFKTGEMLLETFYSSVFTCEHANRTPCDVNLLLLNIWWTGSRVTKKEIFLKRKLIPSVLQLCGKSAAIIIFFLWNKRVEKLMWFFCVFDRNLQVDWQPIKNPSEANRVQHFPTWRCDKLELCSIVIKFEQLSLFFLTETRETFGSICSFLLNGWACLATWKRRMRLPPWA